VKFKFILIAFAILLSFIIWNFYRGIESAYVTDGRDDIREPSQIAKKHNYNFENVKKHSDTEEERTKRDAGNKKNYGRRSGNRKGIERNFYLHRNTVRRYPFLKKAEFIKKFELRNSDGTISDISIWNTDDFKHSKIRIAERYSKSGEFIASSAAVADHILVQQRKDSNISEDEFLSELKDIAQALGATVGPPRTLSRICRIKFDISDENDNEDRFTEVLNAMKEYEQLMISGPNHIVTAI